MNVQEETLSVNGYVIHVSQKALWWTLAAVLIPVACAVVWWCIEKSLNRLAPYEVCWPRPAALSGIVLVMFGNKSLPLEKKS